VTVSNEPVAAATRARRGVVAAMAGLAMLVTAAAVWSTPWPASLGAAVAWLIPLLLPLRGVIAGSRRAYAWATLCVTPYVVAGMTETIANPALRPLAAAIVLAGLAWFATLVRYLRVTRRDEVPAAPQAHS
jgi:uncharacterized membrane protein